MHEPELIAQALELRTHGARAPQIAAAIGVPRRTVSDWLNGRVPTRPQRRPCAAAPDLHAILDATNVEAYVYLLAVYLGDGDLTRSGGSARLRVSLDSRYPEIVETVRSAMTEVMHESPVHANCRPGVNMVIVSACSVALITLFPQHGPGPKHRCDVALVGWQRRLVDRHPEAFIRGLIHSDGCRFIASQCSKGRVYRYPRYSLSNRSADILGEFARQLDHIGVGWTRAGDCAIQIARQPDVARLDRFIGPKR